MFRISDHFLFPHDGRTPMSFLSQLCASVSLSQLLESHTPISQTLTEFGSFFEAISGNFAAFCRFSSIIRSFLSHIRVNRTILTGELPTSVRLSQKSGQFRSTMSKIFVMDPGPKFQVINFRNLAILTSPGLAMSTRIRCSYLAS